MNIFLNTFFDLLQIAERQLFGVLYINLTNYHTFRFWMARKR